MSIYMRAARRTPFISTRPAVRQLIRTFNSAQHLRLKEDGDRSPQEIENLKQEQLKKQEKGEGHWHEGLASGGESNIAADKEKVHDHDEHMEDLQKETAQQHEKDHPHGKDEH